MARNTSALIASAFVARQAATHANTYTDGERLYLHGSLIGWRDGNGFRFHLAGYDTAVTRDRVNAALAAVGFTGDLAVHLAPSRFIAALGGYPFDAAGEDIAVDYNAAGYPVWRIVPHEAPA